MAESESSSGGRTVGGGHPARRLAGETPAPPPRGGRGRIIVTGIIFWYPLAGVTYQFLHYLIGLQRLGYEGSLIGFLWMLGVLGEIGVFLFLPAFFRRFELSTILVASAACGTMPVLCASTP